MSALYGRNELEEDRFRLRMDRFFARADLRGMPWNERLLLDRHMPRWVRKLRRVRRGR